MPGFQGFSSDKQKHVPVPEQFYSELLSEIDDLGELKLALYVLWRLDRMEGNFRYFLKEDFMRDERFLAGLCGPSEDTEAALDAALTKVVRRGFLLSASLQLSGKQVVLYFLNTPRGRAAVEAIQKGSWRHTGDVRQPLEIVPERPNIYRLYEENIGPLTPMIADMLRDAEEMYPPAWIENAMRIAVSNNVRRWRYVEAILRHWKEEGRDERKDRQDTQEDFRRYTKGKFAEFLNP